jgi:hypothetical protein
MMEENSPDKLIRGSTLFEIHFPSSDIFFNGVNKLPQEKLHGAGLKLLPHIDPSAICVIAVKSKIKQTFTVGLQLTSTSIEVSPHC